jgi:hypothetical protein
MTKAKQYHLNFKVVLVNNIQVPSIECDKNAAGHALNKELANFIDSCGPAYTQEIITEISSLNAFTISVNEYKIYSGNEYDSVEIFSLPARASFWNGSGYTNIPLQDFLDILNEWKSFLNSLPFIHKLSNS